MGQRPRPLTRAPAAVRPLSREVIAEPVHEQLRAAGLPVPGTEPDDRTPEPPDALSDEARRAGLEALARELLHLVDPDPTRAGLADTPRRWAQWWMERLAAPTATLDTTFDRDDIGSVEQVDQLVVVSGIRVWSLCEHHLLPFWCDLAIGYKADQLVLGLSKFARIAQLYAQRLQVQERLVQDIRTHLVTILETEDVAVIARGEHLCMTMRGARSPHRMTSSAIGGIFRHSDAARAEFLRLASMQD